MIIKTETALLQAIGDFAKLNGKMPTKINGAFMDLLPIYHFCSYTSHFLGKDNIFITHLGVLELTLDAKASEPYLE